MEKDTEITRVLFVIKDGEVTAVFPYLLGTNEPSTMCCYAHVGQHGSCRGSWVDIQTKATPEQYKALYEELESIGYNLKVLKTFPYMASLRWRKEQLKTYLA